MECVGKRVADGLDLALVDVAEKFQRQMIIRKRHPANANDARLELLNRRADSIDGCGSEFDGDKRANHWRLQF